MTRAHTMNALVCAALLALSCGEMAVARPRGLPNPAEPMPPQQTPEQVQQLAILSHSIWNYDVGPAGAIEAGYRLSHVVFDREGYPVEQVTYSPDGGILRRIVNSYDSERRLHESVGEEPSGIGTARSVFTYDGELITEVMTYRSDGSLITSTEYEHDELDRTILALTRAPDAGLSQRMVIEHDDARDAISVITYDSRGQVLVRSETLRDGEGRAIESTGFLEDGSVTSVTSYTYDGDGALLELLVEDANGVAIQRVTSDHDAEGRLIESIHSTPAAGLEYRIELEYGEDGTLAFERTYNKLREQVSELRHVYEYYSDESDHEEN